MAAARGICVNRGDPCDRSQIEPVLQGEAQLHPYSEQDMCALSGDEVNYGDDLHYDPAVLRER